MSEFHDDYPSYETMALHSEEEGKVTRKKLWKVFWIMLFITIVELIIGFIAPGQGWSGTFALKAFFIVLTIIKAAYIVMSFMHLGHEVKFFKMVVLIPYLVFMSYGIFIILDEGVYSGEPINRTKVDPLLIEQQEKLNAGQHHGAAPAAGEHKEEAHH